MELTATTPPLSPGEQALVSGTKDFRPSDRIDFLAAGCGFRLAPSPGLGDSRPRGAYQTYARARSGCLTLARNVSNDASLPPWLLLTDDIGGFDLWPADVEEDHPISGAAVFAFAATGIVVLLLVIWGLSLAGVIKW